MTTDQQILDSIAASKTMLEAAAKTDLHFSTFKRRALKLGVYTPNQGGKGTQKKSGLSYDLNDILDGKHPGYQSFKLKQKLYDSGRKINKCEECGISEWNGKKIECELDHIDGNSKNNSFDNLRILCPNCHSQTHTFRFKKR